MQVGTISQARDNGGGKEVTRANTVASLQEKTPANIPKEGH